ncbi:MAG: aminoglycoside phosphotransferase family protein [Nitrincola lacisaponensis]|uniref:aminoglycoside phosphotransferase family protein n=1 Tax=Nitrincola lacisaponensis TaxID=267850 RepID=UPI00391C42B4
MGRRQQALKKWVLAQLIVSDPQMADALSLVPVAGDASFRRYFRVTYQQQSYVLMDAPPEHEDCQPFIQIARQWHAAGIRVPRILAEDLTQGFLMLEDFGDVLLRSVLQEKTADDLYCQAFDQLHRIQTLPAGVLPKYDAVLLQREMSLFRDWFLSSWLALELTDAESACLAAVEQRLIESALEQPQVAVHRDYHSRNLMLLPEGGIGVIDFQDAVEGAATYDLVSLLRDSYIHWPEAQVMQWVDRFHQQSPWAARLTAQEFRQAFDWMGMQRQLKVCGIFVRLCLRDGKAGYLQDIPLTLRNLWQSARRYPEFAEFACFLESRVIPRLNQRPELQALNLQDWWKA